MNLHLSFISPFFGRGISCLAIAKIELIISRFVILFDSLWGSLKAIKSYEMMKKKGTMSDKPR